MICVSIISETTEKCIEDMHAAGPYADLLEVRLDYIKKPDLAKILAAREKPVIITVSPAQENGRFEGTEEERIALLRQALALGAEHIDVNAGCPALRDLIAQKGESRVIVSYHNFQETPADLAATYTALRATGADIIKIATMAQKTSDNLAVLDLVRQSDTSIIGLCMGPYGEISRILAPLYGAYLTFASLQAGKESAPGQLPAETLRSVYRIDDIKPGFKLYGLIGNPVSKSKGYLLFNSLFKKYGLNSLYLNFPVEDLNDFAVHFSGRLAGFSVTMPHKRAIMSSLDEIDPAAQKVGAVNSVVNRSGKLAGYNTDIAGALNPIEKKTVIRGRRVTVLGAGGAARAIAAGVVERGGSLTVLNRTVETARELARELGCSFGPLSDFGMIKTDILINMTSVGMHPDVDAAPVDPGLVRDMVVFDAIYNPVKTRLLQEAEKNGCEVISGLEMFICQAAEQFRLFTGIEPDAGFMKDMLQ